MPLRTLNESVNHLTDESHAIRDELTRLREEMRRKTITTRLAIGAVFLLLACVLVAAFQVSLDNQRQIEESQRRWCPLLLTIGPRPGAPAPAGSPKQREYAQHTRQLIKDLSDSYGCTR